MKYHKNVVYRLVQREYAVRGHLRNNLSLIRFLICLVFSVIYVIRWFYNADVHVGVWVLVFIVYSR